MNLSHNQKLTFISDNSSRNGITLRSGNLLNTDQTTQTENLAATCNHDAWSHNTPLPKNTFLQKKKKLKAAH